MNDQKPTFKQAMEATMIWCKSWENDEISDEVISDRIGELIKTVDGARGFFVVSLSIDCPLMDRFPDALIFKLRSSGELIVDLTVKNLAMSSAMVIKHRENNEISDEVISDRIGELIKTVEGARGFFVVSLSIDCPLMDRFPDALIYQLRSSGEIVVDLTVKNLAMSSAMIITHRKNKDPQEVQSEKIKTRCIELLKLLDSNQVKKRLDVLLEATKGNGTDLKFIKQWGYNDEQIKAISESIYQVAT